MSPDRVFVIAEAGVNHNGRLDLALALVDAAAAAGADAVKFQTFRAEDLALPGTATAAYQQGNTGETDQLAMLRKLELSAAQHEAIAARCAERGIEFMSTPFSESAVDLLVSLKIRRLKISSGEITNRPLLEKAASARLPLLLSTGMATLDEARQAVAWVQAAWRHPGRPRPAAGVDGPLVLLHCTSAYPAPDAALNLRALRTLADATGLPVGYSDHSLGNVAALAAASLGACVLEKHITLDRKLPGPDHQASSEPAEFAALVHELRRIEAMLGDGVKTPRPDELVGRAVARRSVVLAQTLPAGTVLAREHLLLRRPASGIAAAELDAVPGRRLRADADAGTVLQWAMLE
ncbi:MAG: N-acetylneuraminate synthase family protein [Thiomonas delicata]